MEIIDWTISFLVGNVLSIFMLLYLKYYRQNGKNSQNSEKFRACFQLAENQKSPWDFFKKKQSLFLQIHSA